MTKKKVFIGLGVVVAVLVALRVVAAFIWPTINDVTTGVTQEYPDLKPQRFDQPAERVFAAALAAAKDMEFEVTGQAPERGEIAAVATTPVFRFKDDVTIRIVREGNGSVVNVRSHSRI